MRKPIAVYSRPNSRRKSVRKINLRVTVEEVQALSKFVSGLELTQKERERVTNTGIYLDAKLRIRERSSSQYDDDDEFD